MDPAEFEELLKKKIASSTFVKKTVAGGAADFDKSFAS